MCFIEDLVIMTCLLFLNEFVSQQQLVTLCFPYCCVIFSWNNHAFASLFNACPGRHYLSDCHLLPFFAHAVLFHHLFMYRMQAVVRSMLTCHDERLPPFNSPNTSSAYFLLSWLL